MKIRFTQHYERISRLLSQESQHKLGRAGILLGARFGSLSGCDNCKIDLQMLTVCVMKPIPPRIYHTIHVLCEKCRLLHSEEVKYYLYLNK